MQHPYFANAFLSNGPPSPSPTRSKKRKRDDVEQYDDTPTKSRSRTASSQTLGLPTPIENSGLDAQHLPLKQDKRNGTSSPVGAEASAESFGSSDSVTPIQQITPPTSASPSVGSDFRMSAPLVSSSPSRTRRSTASTLQNAPNPDLMLLLPSLVIQPPNSSLYFDSLEAAILSLRRLLTLNTSGSLGQPLAPEQECYAWMMFAEIGMQLLIGVENGKTEESGADNPQASRTKAIESASTSLPSWAPQSGEIETAISRSLRLADQIASLRPLRHQLTLMHAKIVFMQDNHKHSKVLLKRLLPLSTTSQALPREKVWTSYEAHLSITDQILNTPIASLSGGVDVQAVSSQLAALSMLADQYGDFTVRQLCAVTRLTVLFQNYEVSEVIDTVDVDAALAEAEAILGLDVFDKPINSSTDQQPANGAATDKAAASTTTPGATIANGIPAITPLSSDILAGGANHKTPAFPLPTNPLGMNVGDAASGEDLIPPYLRYLRAQTLMIGVLWLTHTGFSTKSAERLNLLHEMMDKLNDLSKSNGTVSGWSSDRDVGVIEVPLPSNPEHPLRIHATHPRVLYQLTFVISGVVKRDGAGKKPKRKIFAEEGLRVGRWDDVRTSHDSKPPIMEGGSSLDLAPGLGLQSLRQAQSSIEQIRAIAYCELISACLIRSEFDEAEQHLSDLVSFVRASDAINTDAPTPLWNQFNSRITLLYGHLAHALGQSRRALDCYKLVCHLEEEGSVLWGMGVVGDFVLRIGIAALRPEPPQEERDSNAPEENISPAGKFWRDGEREAMVQMASGVVERCISGTWGDHMAIVGRILAASLSDEIVRAKQNLKTALDVAGRSRDNYLRLLTLILTASQYVHTYADYALVILETSKQLASSLGAVGANPTGNEGADATVEGDGTRRSTRTAKGKDAAPYHVGNARAGLWIGERFFELYKRRSEREKAGKQHALNVVFEKAVQELDTKSNLSEKIMDLPIMAYALMVEEPTSPAKPERSHATIKQDQRRRSNVTRKPKQGKAPVLQIDTSATRARAARESTDSEADVSISPHDIHSSQSMTREDGSSRSRHYPSSSATSLGGSSVWSAAPSNSTRRSTRSAAAKQSIVESDDENMEEDGDDYEEDEEDDY